MQGVKKLVACWPKTRPGREIVKRNVNRFRKMQFEALQEAFTLVP